MVSRYLDMDWWMRSSSGQVARIGLGAAVFCTLALWDLHRNGRRATRWREYLVLIACVVAALVYGAINDQITTTISWEYFAYGKGLADVVPNARPNSPAFRWEAAKIGMQATWTAGLIIGVALLIANNPWRSLPRLRYTSLLRFVPITLLITALVSACLGVAGYYGAFVSTNSDFAQMVAHNEFRPRRFMAVYGEHLGGYVGGVIGTVVAVVGVVRARKRLAAGASDPRTPL